MVAFRLRHLFHYPRLLGTPRHLEVFVQPLDEALLVHYLYSILRALCEEWTPGRARPSHGRLSFDREHGLYSPQAFRGLWSNGWALASLKT